MNEYANRVYQGKDKVVVSTVTFIPSLCPEFDPSGYGVDCYTFYEVDLKKKRNREMAKDEVKAFYKGLQCRKDRIDLWYSMKENGWVGREKEEDDRYFHDSVYGYAANKYPQGGKAMKFLVEIKEKDLQAFQKFLERMDGLDHLEEEEKTPENIFKEFFFANDDRCNEFDARCKVKVSKVE